MDLSTPRRERLLSRRFEGSMIWASGVLYTPMRISAFEIADSKKHDGKKMLVMQAQYVGKDGVIENRPVFTESYTLIGTINGTERELPHLTKIIRKRDGYLYFVALNDKEKSNLLNYLQL